MKRRRTIKWLVLSVIWIGVILLFSSQNGTDSHGVSQQLARMIGGIIFPDFGQWTGMEQTEWIEGIDPLVRKTAHFLEYGVLGALTSLFVMSILSSLGKLNSKMKCGLLSFYPCMMIACADEFLQISSGGRGASSADVILDCIGVIAGMIVCLNRCNADEQSGVRQRTRAGRRRR